MYIIVYCCCFGLFWGCTTLCDEVCQWLATGQWFSPGTLVSSIKKIDRHDITEILLKVALITTITLTRTHNLLYSSRAC